MGPAVMGDFNAFVPMLDKVSLVALVIKLQWLARECAEDEVKVYVSSRVLER